MASYVVGGRGVDMYIECTEISGFDRRRLVRTTPSFIGEASSFKRSLFSHAFAQTDNDGSGIVHDNATGGVVNLLFSLGIRSSKRLAAFHNV